uniref:Uncharacterized protein n=1 Tax=Aegilops tauschii subsp. strangulata TaxID=200361 RepID=A0A453D5S8_AEGTS
RDQEGQLLPRPRARRRPLHLGRPRAAPLHAALRRRAAGALLHPQLPQHGVALRRRGRHVLHLLHHWPRPRPLQDHRRRRGPRERRRRADAHPDAEGVAGVPGHRRHRVRVPVLHRAAGDTGHAAVVAAGGGDAEEGERDRDARHHLLLPLRGLLRLRGLRRRRAGEPAHRLRLLRALLARRLRQRLHRAPHPRRLPVLQPADLHRLGPLAGGEVPGQRLRVPDLRSEARAGPAALRAEPAAGLLPDGVRGQHDGAGRGVPLLQRGAGPAGRAHLLAAHHLPPRRDVLRAAPCPGMDADVGRAPGIQRRLLRRRDLRIRRLRPGRRPKEARLLARIVGHTATHRPLFVVVHVLPLAS